MSGEGAAMGFTQVALTDLVRDGASAINRLGDQLAARLRHMPYGTLGDATTTADASATTTALVAASMTASSFTVVNVDGAGGARRLRVTFRATISGASGGELVRAIALVDGAEVARAQETVNAAGGAGQQAVTVVGFVASATPGLHSLGASVLRVTGGTSAVLGTGSQLVIEDVGPAVY